MNKSISTSIIFLLSLIFCHTIYAQNISGIVKNKDGEALISATVQLLGSDELTITNLNGKYEFKNISPGEYSLLTSYVGFLNDTSSIIIDKESMILDIVLLENAISISQTVIRADKIVERTTISNISFSKEDLQVSHGLTEDPLRTLASLPGIGRNGDLFSPSALYIRGGSPDENLFLLDNNKIYFPYYFGGQKSIFNTEVSESIELLTGGFSAMYGNHLSSVLNVTTRDGNMNNLGAVFSFGFYNSAALIEGPILKNKASFLLAARRTYLDLFIKDNPAFPVPSFGDITFKFSYKVNEKNKISLSGISSDESLDFTVKDTVPGLPNKLKTRGNNHFQTLQVQSRLSDKLYNKLSLTNALSMSNAEISRNIFLDIDAWQAGFRNDFSYYLNSQSKIRTGIEWQYGRFDFEGTFPLDPEQTDPNDTTIALVDSKINYKDQTQQSAYALYEGLILPGLGINAGLRWDRNPFNENSDFSPRLSLNYQLSTNSKVRMATGIYRQFPGTGLSNELISEQAIHYILGYEYKFSKNIYGWIEAYLKDYKRLVNSDTNLNYLNNGIGTAKGLELFLRKDKGKINGWISYALSHSERTAPLTVEVKDFGFDQRHILNLVAQYHLKKWEEKEKWFIPVLLHLNMRYADGTPYTPVIGATATPIGWAPISGEVLSARNSDYLNLNFRIEWKFKVGKKGKGVSFMEAWNLLNRKNVLGRNYQYGDQYPNNVSINEYYSTPFLMAGGFRIELGGSGR